ncbi:unnamed protein product [Clonostachys rosea]|uniref:Cyanovirin-N domain-containing protein n=1 Tax=Bionectria ochroleuca TaxID=29856 RepID=A0ABY6U4L9_BIOOC|nr:unnamed protein product [Clonostachys rosea]
MRLSIPIFAALAMTTSAQVIRATTYLDAKCGQMNANTYVSINSQCATLTVGTMAAVKMSTSDEGVKLEGYSTTGCSGSPAVTITEKDTCIDLTGLGILSWKGIF